MADDEHVFYLAGAAIVSMSQLGEYKLWLLDHTNTAKVELWQSGQMGKIPDSGLTNECVTLNTQYTFESPSPPGPSSPGGEIHTVDDAVMEKLERDLGKRLQRDVWASNFGAWIRVAVSETLWETIAEPLHPLPPSPHRAEAYRIQLLARRIAGAPRYYFGFHAKVIGIGKQHPIVQFFGWTNHKLGADEVDLASDAFEPQGKYTKLSATPQVGDEGALFVALDKWKTLPFLESPKVPWGAQSHGPHRTLRKSSRALTAAQTVPAVDATPVVVASDGNDDWLDAARERVHDEDHAGDQPGVIAAISSLLEAHPDREAIELLSHSNDDNLLSFDGWTVNSNAFANASNRFKDLVRGRIIRLVGCSTAAGDKAEAVLRGLEEHLGVVAYGTRGLIGLANLGSEGSDAAKRSELFVRSAPGGDSARFVEEDALRLGGEPRPLTAADRDVLLAGLTVESRQTVERMLRLMPPLSYPFTGILRMPSATIPLVPSDPASPPGRIDALFRGALIRFTRGRWKQPRYLELLFWVNQASIRDELQQIFRWPV